jgi:Mrp family chromosome partitioning ATPase
MFRRRLGRPVLAEVGFEGEPRRPGLLRRGELDALAGLAGSLAGARVVVILGEEAKSEVSVGLATAALLAGRRVALLESDLEWPVLATTLGLEESPGLGEYLRFEAQAPDVLQSLVPAGPAAAGAVEPLVCIVAGRPTVDAATLLGGEGFASMVAKLRDAYDLVVVCGPRPGPRGSPLHPVGAAEMTLACGSRSGLAKARWSRRADGLVIVTERQRS